jgi:two-component system chemotaxis response regulator CheY
MIIIDDELVQNYLAKCAKHVAIMEQGLLALELSGAEVDEELVSRLLRAAKAVKHGAELAGLATISELAHRLERALAPVTLDRVAPTPQRVTVLLSAIDTLRALLDDPGESDGADTSAIMDALTGLSTGSQPSSAPCRGADWRLRTLLVEDDFTSRLVLQTFLSRYGDCHIAVNGREAVDACRAALEDGRPYDLICMDIMMPEMDGREAVHQIRATEEARGILSTDGAKIIMTTAVTGLKEVVRCFQDLCDAYLVKPIDLGKLLAEMKLYDLAR